MRTLNNVTAIKACLTAICMVSSMASAGSVGGTGGALESTQWINKVELVKQTGVQVEQHTQLVNSYLKQIQQYEAQIKQLNPLNNLPSGFQDAMNSYDAVKAYKGRLDNLVGSITTQKSLMLNRFNEARLSGLSWDQYVAKTQEQIKSKNDRAIERLEMERKAVEQVQEDYETAKKYQEKITATDGMHGSMQLMNEQMNKLIVQNARLTSVIASSNMSRTDQESVDAAAMQSRSLRDDYIKKSFDNLRRRQEDFAKPAPSGN